MEKDNLNITIKIGEKSFPMKVPFSEEESYRKAGNLAQETYLKYKNKYINLSSEDILTMVAFDLAKRFIDLNAKKENTELFLEISELVTSLGEYLEAQ